MSEEENNEEWFGETYVEYFQYLWEEHGFLEEEFDYEFWEEEFE